MATIAVFIALGGTSLAAGKLITSKQIKRGAITTKSIKNGTIASSDLSKALRAQLAKAAAPGPQGPQGIAGPAGPAGADGAPGLVRAYGHILANGSLDENYAHKGIVSSRIVNGYQTCVKLDPSIDAVHAAPTATPDFTTNFSFGPTGNIGWVAVTDPKTSCSDNEVHIATGTYGAGQNGGTPVGAPGAYFLMVP